jgi:hypothetical protein
VSSSPRAPPMGCRSPQPQRLSTRRQEHQRYLTPTTTIRGYYSLSRVLTFDYAGFRQRSLSSRRFGLRLRGGSGLLSGRRDFFSCHRCRGFIPLPGQICRLPAEYTSQSSVRHDYHFKYYSGRCITYRLDWTTVTVGRRGCWRCPPVQPRRVPPLAPPLLQ